MIGSSQASRKLLRLRRSTGRRRHENAEDILLAKEAKPGDPAVYMTLAGYYNRQGQFEKTIKELEDRASRDPKNPEAHYTIATFYRTKRSDARLKENEKRIRRQRRRGDRQGAADQTGLHRALVYKGLLLRLKAGTIGIGPAAALIKEATVTGQGRSSEEEASGAGD
jgi:predicted Zn-dependent protease